MFQVKLKLKNINIIEKNHGLEKDGKVTEFLRDTVDRFCDSYVPMESGALKNHKSYPTKHEIKYTSPYAHYLYKGTLMLAPNGSSYAKLGERKHYTGKSLKIKGSPKRGPEWDKRMLSDRKKDIIKDVTNYIKGGNKWVKSKK